MATIRKIHAILLYFTLFISAIIVAAAGRFRNVYHHRIGIITWALPPSASVGGHRPLSLVQYFSKHSPTTVFTVQSLGELDGQAPTESGLKLEKRIPTKVQRFWAPKSIHTLPTKLSPKIDGGFENFVLYVFFLAKLISREKPELLIATGPPFFLFPASLLIAKLSGIRCILDYRDEWSECPFDFVRKGPFDKYLEGLCLRYADRIVFTTESHLRHQCLVFNIQDNRNFHVVPNGWDPEDHVDTIHTMGDATANESPNIVKLGHFGHLSHHTPLGDFVRSLNLASKMLAEQNKQIILYLVGKRTEKYIHALRSLDERIEMRLIDHVPKDVASTMMKEMDFLLLLSSNDMNRYLPTKLFDYVASGVNILVFGKEGESSRVVKNLKCGFFVDSDQDNGLYGILNTKISTTHTKENCDVKVWLEQHKREKLASAYFNIIYQKSDKIALSKHNRL